MTSSNKRLFSTIAVTLITYNIYHYWLSIPPVEAILAALITLVVFIIGVSLAWAGAFE